MYIAHLSAYPSQRNQFTISTVENYEQDVIILRSMFSAAINEAQRLQACRSSGEPVDRPTKGLSESLKLRVAINNPDMLSYDRLPFVAFISKKQGAIPTDIQRSIDAADSGMLLELAKVPTLISYVSLQLADENWYNLVVFSHEQTKQRILTVPLHHHAAYDLAPHYYQWIRLHHGTIQRESASFELLLHITKYYEFPIPAAAPTIYEQTHLPVPAIAPNTAAC